MNDNIINFPTNKETEEKVSFLPLFITVILSIISTALVVIYGWKAHIAVLDFIEPYLDKVSDVFAFILLFGEAGTYGGIMVSYFFFVGYFIFSVYITITKVKCFNFPIYIRCIEFSLKNGIKEFLPTFLHTIGFLLLLISGTGFAQKEYKLALIFAVIGCLCYFIKFSFISEID